MSPAEVRPYDFRRPEGLDRQAMAVTKTIFDLAGRLVAARLGLALHARVSVVLESLNQIEWSTFESRLSEQGALFGLELAPHPAQVVYYLPHDLAMAIIDLRLAGSGKRTYAERPLTELEHRILTVPSESVSGALVAAIDSMAPNTITGRAHEIGGLHSLQLIDTHEQYVAATYTTHLAAGVDYNLFCCAPVATLRPIIDVVEMGGPIREHKSRNSSPTIERQAQEIPVPLSLCFEDIEASLSTVQSLDVGAVLSLDHPVDIPLLLISSSVPLYRANRVMQGRRLAAQIVERLPGIQQPTDATTNESECIDG